MRISFRCTPAERDALDAVAKENGTSRMHVIRDGVNTYVADYRERNTKIISVPAPSHDDIDRMSARVAQLRYELEAAQRRLAEKQKQAACARMADDESTHQRVLPLQVEGAR